MSTSAPSLLIPPLQHPQYRPDIDGLRAIAVLSVLGFHAFPMWVRGGFIGVDIFFVISGFLITSIILSSLECKGFSYRTFYVRRIRRIFPALILVMAATLAAGWFLLLPYEWTQFGLHLASGAGFVSNFVFWSKGEYFITASGTKLLLHLWSLAIEEQFYIVWPLLLVLVWRLKWPTLPILAGIALAYFAVNLALVISGNPTAAFYATRAWELMAGGMLACRRPHKMRPWLPWSPALRAHVQSAAGIGLIAFGLIFIRADSTFPGWWALLPVLGTVLCIAAGPGGQFNGPLLASRPMVWIGLISYPLYLWHWPLLVFARVLNNGMPSRDVRIGIVIAAFVLAWLTYRLVEKYLRYGRGVRPAVALCAIMAVLGLCGVLAASGKWNAYRTSKPGLSVAAAKGDRIIWPGTIAPAPVTASGGPSIYRLGNGPRKVLLMGDSYIMMMAPRLQSLLAHNPKLPVTLDFSTAFQCLGIAHVRDNWLNTDARDCTPQLDHAFKAASDGNYDAIVLSACWNCYFLLPTYVDHRHYYDTGNDRLWLNTPEGTDAALHQLSLQISLWVHQQHKKVYLLLNIPTGPPFEPESLIENQRWHWENAYSLPTAPWPAEQEHLYDRMRQMALRSGAQVLDPIPDLCRDRQCLRALPDGTPIYIEGYHLTPSYVREHATWIDPLVAP